AREDEHRRLPEVLAEMSGRGEHPARRAVGRLLRRAGVVRHLHELAPRLAIELAEARALGGVADDHEAPALTIAAARRADRGVHDLPEHGFGDRISLEAPDGPLRGHDVEEVHVPSGVYSRSYIGETYGRLQVPALRSQGRRRDADAEPARAPQRARRHAARRPLRCGPPGE